MTEEEYGLTRYEDITVLEGLPCRLSFSKLSAVVSGESAASTGQVVKLFLSPDVRIKPNSKIVVEQSGTVAEYTASGVPAVYATHQEILLELFQGWA